MMYIEYEFIDAHILSIIDHPIDMKAQTLRSGLNYAKPNKTLSFSESR